MNAGNIFFNDVWRIYQQADTIAQKQGKELESFDEFCDAQRWLPKAKAKPAVVGKTFHWLEPIQTLTLDHLYRFKNSDKAFPEVKAEAQKLSPVKALQLWAVFIDTYLDRHAEAFFEMALIWEFLKVSAEAEKAFKKVLELKPENNNQTKYLLALVLIREGRKTEAAKLLQEARHSTNREVKLGVLVQLGLMLEQAKDFPNALECYSEILTLDSTRVDVIPHYLMMRRKQCLWPAHEPVGSLSAQDLRENDSLMGCMLESDDPAEQLRQASLFVSKYVQHPNIVTPQNSVQD